MRRTGVRPSSSIRGFALLEALVGLGLTGVVMTLIVGSVLSMRGWFSTDLVRVRINGNLRSAMDIISMNTRQAGENLTDSFPAVLVSDSGSTDILKLRRSLIPEVLTLCRNATAGQLSVSISSTALTNSECVLSSVTPLRTVYQNERTAAGGTLRLYLYDRSAKVGEFVTYSAEATSAGEYVMTVTALSRAYPAVNTSIYALEEYSFELDSANTTLNVYVNGDRANPRAVAFSVTGFGLALTMSDGSNLAALAASDAYTWKDIRQLAITLTGQELYRKKTISSSITSEFFPRNVLSFG